MAALIPETPAWSSQALGIRDGVSDRQKHTSAPVSPARLNRARYRRGQDFRGSARDCSPVAVSAALAADASVLATVPAVLAGVPDVYGPAASPGGTSLVTGSPRSTPRRRPERPGHWSPSAGRPERAGCRCGAAAHRTPPPTTR